MGFPAPMGLQQDNIARNEDRAMAGNSDVASLLGSRQVAERFVMAPQ